MKMYLNPWERSALNAGMSDGHFQRPRFHEHVDYTEGTVAGAALQLNRDQWDTLGGDDDGEYAGLLPTVIDVTITAVNDPGDAEARWYALHDGWVQ